MNNIYTEEMPSIYKGFPLAYKKAIKKVFGLTDEKKLVVDFRKELKDDLEKHIAQFKIDSHFTLEIIRSEMENKCVPGYIIEETLKIENEDDLKLFLAGMEAGANVQQTITTQKLFNLVEWYK